MGPGVMGGNMSVNRFFSSTLSRSCSSSVPSYDIWHSDYIHRRSFLLRSCPHIRECKRMCLDMGSLVAWRWSLLSLQLDGFVVIFSNLIIFLPEKSALRSLANLTRYMIYMSGLWSGGTFVTNVHTDANHSSQKRRIL